MTTLEKQREDTKNLLFLDNGDLFPTPKSRQKKLNARIAVDILNYMGLDAMNLGQQEFYFGTEFLAELAEKVSFPFISSNIKTLGNQSWLKKYVIKEVNGLKIAVLGILPEYAFSNYVNPQLVKSLAIINPEKAIKEVLGEIGDQADIVILLSQLTEEETTVLIEKFPQINFAVAKGEKRECKMTGNPDQKVASSGVTGQFYLSVDIALTKDGKVSVTQVPPVELVDSVQHNAVVDSMIMEPFEEINRLRNEARKASNERAQQSNSFQVQKLSEDEFFKQLNEQRAKLKTLRPEQEGEKINASLLFNGQVVPATIRRVPDDSNEGDSQQPTGKNETKNK